MLTSETGEIHSQVSSIRYITYNRKDVTSFTRFLEGMKSTSLKYIYFSVKSDFLFWDMTTYLKEIAGKKRKKKKDILYSNFESLQRVCEISVPALFYSHMYLSNDRVKKQ